MPESRSEQLVEHVVETPESRDADLAFVRPKCHPLTHKPIAMNHLRLGDHKRQILSLVRPLVAPPVGSARGKTPCHRASCSHAHRAMPFSQPTAYKRAKRASYNLDRSTSIGWHDALRFSCVMFGVSVRHQLSNFNSLSYMHTPPPIFSKNLRYSTLRWQNMKAGITSDELRTPLPVVP